jgi:sialate O-acetylesterase
MKNYLHLIKRSPFRTQPRLSALLLAAFGLLPQCPADIRLPAIISNNMVLRKTQAVPVWGKADPGEQVSVTLGDQTASVLADESGRWKAILNLENSGPGPFEMTVEGENRLVVSNVAVGEVWLASGQSNMEWPIEDSANAKEVIAASKNPLVRQFVVQRSHATEPLDDVKGAWQEASPATTGKFSAVGYHFAKSLSAETGAPVGVISSAWGGTRIEPWMSLDAVESIPQISSERKAVLERMAKQTELKKIYTQEMPKWVESYGRTDESAPDPSIYTAADIDLTGWTPIKAPGEITGEGLPHSGVVWLRREIEIPSDGGPVQIELPLDGFDTVYWNGRQLRNTTFETYPGNGLFRNLRTPRDSVYQQKNVLAIRLYLPTGPGRFSKVPSVKDLVRKIELKDGWHAKAERGFPDLDAETLAQAPKPAEAPPTGDKVPTALFNAMIAPLLPASINGIIWYQGESNAANASQYKDSFAKLISDWREKWNRSDLPFYFCQLAAYRAKPSKPAESDWASLREAQSSALALPHTGQVVLIDSGEEGDIHPRDKKTVGERLSRIALAKLHSRDIVYSGPIVESWRFEGGKAEITFRHAEGGLEARPLAETHLVSSTFKKTAPLLRNSPASQLEGFQIRGADTEWFWADARIDGDKVIVWCDKVSAPTAVRYGWADNPIVNLFNRKGLPSAPFRTDAPPPNP